MGAYLSSPKTNKESDDGGNLNSDPSRYGLSCMQGWRKNMEDSHICYNNLKVKEIEEDISIYGVFDGHGGPNVSKWISYNFRRIFLKCIKEANEELIKKNLDKSKNYKLKLIKLTLEKTFLKLDEEMLLTENQEKLKKYSVPTQENEEESDTRENYIYSILNDIMSKNISIKAIERDGKRCLQVVYNKDGNPVGEEGNADTSSLSVSEENNLSEDNDKSSALFNNTDQETTDENFDIIKNEEKDNGISEKSEDNNNEIKKDDEDVDLVNNNGINNNKIKNEDKEKENEEKNKINITKNLDVKDENNEDLEKNSINLKNTDQKLELSDKIKIENNVEANNILTDLNEGKCSTLQKGIIEESKNKIDNKENFDHINEDENNSINTKRLKKDSNSDCSNHEKEYKEEEKSKNEENDKIEIGKSELTYDNLKYMEETAEEKNRLGEHEISNNSTDGNVSYEENSTRLYERSSSGSDEGISYDETITNVIDNNISNNNDNNEADDCNGIYSSEELRLFENYYSNDYEDNIAYSCGSTALVAVILKGYLIVANAGDSRAIVCFNGNSLGMSTDHKPHLQSEEARIKKAGGYIANGRVDGNLNLTRAIGDLHYKKDPFLPQKDQKISAFPEITCVTLTPEDEFLFLACDGIWDCKEGQDIVLFVKTRLEKFEEITNDMDAAQHEDNNNSTNNEFDEKEKMKNDYYSINKEEKSNNQKNDENKETDIKSVDIDTNENKENSVFQEENKNGKIDEEIKDEKEDDKNQEQKENEGDKYDSAPIIERKKYEKFNKLSQICEELCDECLSNNYKENDGIGCDNMTCLLVQYNPLYKMQTEKKFLNIDEIE